MGYAGGTSPKAHTVGSRDNKTWVAAKAPPTPTICARSKREVISGQILSYGAKRSLVFAMLEFTSSTESARYDDSASARSRSSFAPSPRQALPCIQASVVGSVEAKRSSIARAFLVCEK